MASPGWKGTRAHPVLATSSSGQLKGSEGQKGARAGLPPPSGSSWELQHTQLWPELGPHKCDTAQSRGEELGDADQGRSTLQDSRAPEVPSLQPGRGQSTEGSHAG